ncbi:MAG: hypothetical protein AAGB12_01430 [Pseudomonadota bacterium]
MNKLNSFGVFILLASLLSACSTQTRVESDLGIADAPDWVNEGYQALNNDDGRLFHGVGFAPRMLDASLQRSTADTRARAEVAKTLSSYMEVVSRDYIASAGSQENEISQQSIARKIENITKLNVSGAVIIARWKDQKSGSVYSLAELNMSKVQNIVSTAKQMDNSFQQFFESKSDSLFDQLISDQ